MIENYSFGFVIVDGKNYQHDVWIDSLGNVKDWQREESHLVKNEDVKELYKKSRIF